VKSFARSKKTYSKSEFALPYETAGSDSAPISILGFLLQRPNNGNAGPTRQKTADSELRGKARRDRPDEGIGAIERKNYPER